MGHIRRVSAILHYLLNIKNDELTNVRFTLYVPFERLEYSKDWDEIKYLNGHSNVTIEDFKCPANYYEHSLEVKKWNEIHFTIILD